MASVGHAVAGQKLALAFGGRAAMAPHRGHDEGLVAHLAQRIDDRSGHQVDGVNSAAADPDRDRAAGLDPLAQAAAQDQAADRTGHVIDPRLRDRLPHSGQGRKHHHGIH